MNIFFWLAVVFVVDEGLFQLSWFRMYFSNGIYLRSKKIDVASMPAVNLEAEKNEFLRNFELKKVNNNEFSVRQGKFGIVSNTFFHGAVKFDENSGQIIIRIFINLSVVFIAMAIASEFLDNVWLGAAAGFVVAWGTSRCFVNDRLLISIAAKVREDVAVLNNKNDNDDENCR